MTDPKKEPQPRSVVVAGRTLLLSEPTSAQILLLHRAYKVANSSLEAFAATKDKAERERAARLGMDAGATLLDIIERFIASPVDRLWLVDKFINGELDLPDLNPIAAALGADDEQEQPVKRAVRGSAKGK